MHYTRFKRGGASYLKFVNINNLLFLFSVLIYFSRYGIFINMKATTKTTVKKPVAKTPRKAKNPAEASKSHSISCDDVRWDKIQKLAEKAGMNVSKYIISKVLK